VRVRRPLSAVVVAMIAFALIIWLHSGDIATRFQSALLFVSYWVPAFVAIVAIDWRYRSAGRDVRSPIDPAEEATSRRDAIVALATFFAAFAAAVPFMHTNLIVGPVATALHGADLAYFVNFFVAAIGYGGYRALRSSSSLR